MTAIDDRMKPSESPNWTHGGSYKKGGLKITCLSLYYWPISPGMGTRFPHMLVRVLRRLHNVTVITGTVGDKIQTLGRAFTVEHVGGVRVIRLAIPLPSGRSMLEALLSYVSFSMLCIPIILFFTRDTDCYMSLSPHPTVFLSFQTFVVSRIQRAAHILHLGDLWPHQLIDVLGIKNRLVNTLIRWFHLTSFAVSDAIITLTQSIKDALTLMGVFHGKMVVVPLSVNTALFRPMSKDNTMIESMLEPKVVVMYSGNFGMAYDFVTLFSAAEKLLERSDIHFILRGDGVLRRFILDTVEKRRLSNVLVLDPVAGDEEIVKFLNLADIFVVPLLPVAAQATAIPSKVLEFMACGKPLICCAEGELADLIRRFDAGIAVPPGDSEALTRAILQLASSPERTAMGLRGRKSVVKEFSPDYVLDTMQLALKTAFFSARLDQ